MPPKIARHSALGAAGSSGQQAQRLSVGAASSAIPLRNLPQLTPGAIPRPGTPTAPQGTNSTQVQHQLHHAPTPWSSFVNGLKGLSKVFSSGRLGLFIAVFALIIAWYTYDLIIYTTCLTAQDELKNSRVYRSLLETGLDGLVLPFTPKAPDRRTMIVTARVSLPDWHVDPGSEAQDGDLPQRGDSGDDDHLVTPLGTANIGDSSKFIEDTTPIRGAHNRYLASGSRLENKRLSTLEDLNNDFARQMNDPARRATEEDFIEKMTSAAWKRASQASSAKLTIGDLDRDGVQLTIHDLSISGPWSRVLNLLAPVSISLLLLALDSAIDQFMLFFNIRAEVTYASSIRSSRPRQTAENWWSRGPTGVMILETLWILGHLVDDWYFLVMPVLFTLHVLAAASNSAVDVDPLMFFTMAFVWVLLIRWFKILIQAEHGSGFHWTSTLMLNYLQLGAIIILPLSTVYIYSLPDLAEAMLYLASAGWVSSSIMRFVRTPASATTMRGLD